MIQRLVDTMRRHATAISVSVLVLLAYIPALTAAPGRMPADSKLYVYLDPGRFLGDAATTFDPRQYAGWVPHQHIAYLWPTGPWFWCFETLGVPDWVAHRLWIGTLLALAGLGTRWMARVLGVAPLAALAAALVYQLSPYILPYVSRTSVLLLPYAGLGWIVGLTVLASLRGRWRDPAAIALVVLTVGAVNATALAMVIPAPALWLIHAAWGRLITWRRALVTAAKTALLCVGVSMWWIVMLVIQSRFGADVLAYSESLGAVSFTSTSTEVARGLGYWLFYVRDAYGATTTASLDHLVSVKTIVAGYVVLAICLGGLACCRWSHRRFAALLVGAGVVLGVGVHPIDDPSPLMSVLVGDGESGLALALRSSTRAVPVLLLGLGLGAAAVVTNAHRGAALAESLVRRRSPGGDGSRISSRAVRIGTAFVIGAAAVVALPALRNGGFVDPVLERDQDPPEAWMAAAAALDGRSDGYRVLQVPGAEFGAFQWGYTVDQPLPALTERSLLTRDLLPLGSPAAMDLIFALDDRIQTDTLESDAVVVVSRLLGVDTIWVAGDVSYDRFRLARPEVVMDELGDLDGIDFGEPTIMGSAVPMIDNRSLSDPRIGTPIPPVRLLDVPAPIPVTRVKEDLVVLAGSGDGIVDAAAAGVLDGSEAVLYAATVTADGNENETARSALDASPYRYVITDSNRDRAHHWRSSQDVTGFTESARAESDVLRVEPGDQRLPVFGPEVDGSSTPADQQTVSVQDGPVTARASGYGEPFAYLPEDRPAMAIDGDRSTAWTVSDRAPAVGEFIELTLDDRLIDDGTLVEHVDLLQPSASADQRTITEVEIATPDIAPQRVVLDDRSRTGSGQRIELEPTSGPFTITITATTTPQPPIGEAVGGVGFVEVDLGLGPTTEWIRPPVDVDDFAADASGVDVVLTRLRTEPTDRWRADPEPVLARRVALATPLTGETEATLRLDQRLDDETLAELLGEPVVASSHLLGAPNTRGAAALDDDASTAWTTNFDAAIGERIAYRGAGTVSELTIVQPGGDHSPITGLRVTDPAGEILLDVPPGDDAALPLPRPIDLTAVTVEISAVEPRIVPNRRFNEPTRLPAAISELRFDGRSPAVRPVERLSASCREDLLSLDGAPIALSFDVATADALAGDPIRAEVCGGPMDFDAGEHDIASTAGSATGFDVDRVTIRTPSAGTERATPIEPLVVNSSSRDRTLDVPPCPDGCWVILGEGFNVGWTASADGTDLGKPTLIDGNANGWWLEPTDRTTRVRIDWPVQRGLNMAFLATVVSVVACLVLILRSRRVAASRPPASAAPGDAASAAMLEPMSGSSGRWSGPIVAGLSAGLFVGWTWAIPVVVVWGFASAFGLRRFVAAVGFVILTGVSLAVTMIVALDRPFPNAGWPARFDDLHPWTLTGVVLLVTGAVFDARAVPSDPAGSVPAGSVPAGSDPGDEAGVVHSGAL